MENGCQVDSWTIWLYLRKSTVEFIDQLQVALLGISEANLSRRVWTTLPFVSCKRGLRLIALLDAIFGKLSRFSESANFLGVSYFIDFQEQIPVFFFVSSVRIVFANPKLEVSV